MNDGWVSRVSERVIVSDDENREASRAPKLWYRTAVGPWSMCRHGAWTVDCTQYRPPDQILCTLAAVETGIRRVGGRVGWVGWMDAWMGQA